MTKEHVHIPIDGIEGHITWTGSEPPTPEQLSILNDMAERAYKMCSDQMAIKVTIRMQKARDYVDLHIAQFERPPTYEQVAKYLGLTSTNTAYHRLRGYRHKMKRNA